MPTLAEIQALKSKKQSSANGSGSPAKLSKMRSIIKSRGGNTTDSMATQPEPKRTMGDIYTESLKDALTGVQTGFGNTWGGLQQLFGGDKQRLDKEYAQRMATQAQAEERSPWSAVGGNIFGSAASTPIPGLGQAKLAGLLFGKGSAMAAPVFEKLFAQTLRGTTDAALASGAQYAPEGTSKLGNAAQGAGIGFGASGLLGLPGSIYSKLKPSYAMRGNLTPEQLQENLEAAAGTNTEMGAVIGNKALSDTYQNVLTSVPFSGAADMSQKAAQQVTERGNNLFERISGNLFAPKDANADAGQDLLNGLRKGRAFNYELSNKKYEEVNQLADALGISVKERPNMSSVAKNYIEDIKSNSDLEAKFPEAVMSELERYSKPANKATFKGADLLRSDLRKESTKYYKEGDAYIGEMYKKLKEARDLDIDMAVSQYPMLKNMRKEAHDFYSTNISPFKNEELGKFLNDFDSNSDKLASAFFKPSKAGKEESHQLEVLTKAIDKSPNSDKLREALRQEIFSPAFDPDLEAVNPVKLSNIFKKTGTKQREQLFKDDPELINELKKFTKTTKMNQDALNIMFNPQTGKREIAWKAPAALLTAASSGYAAAGPLGAIGAVAAPLVGADLATSWLTSPVKREELVKKMITPESQFTMAKMLSDELKRTASRGYAAKESPKKDKARLGDLPGFALEVLESNESRQARRQGER